MKRVLKRALVALALTTAVLGGDAQAQVGLPISPASPVIYCNDDTCDVYTDEFLMALASAGSINLKGIITDSSIQPYNPYISSAWYENAVTERAGIRTKALASGFANIPVTIRGVKGNLVQPASNVPEDTVPHDTPGSRLIRDEARLASPQTPLLVVVGGPVSTVVDAYLLDPSIAANMIVLFAGEAGTSYLWSQYNAWCDGWAMSIAVQRLTLVHYLVTYASDGTVIPSVPKSRILTDLPTSTLRQWMYTKHHPTNPLPNGGDADGCPAVAVMQPSFVTSSKRMSFDRNSSYGGHTVPMLKDDPNGKVYYVTAVNHTLATTTWWAGMANAAAWSAGSTFNGITNFFTQAYTGTRNNHTGALGYEFTPTQDLTVTALGRSVSGTMSQNHGVRIWRVSNASLVASVTVTPSSLIDGLGYSYEMLGNPVTLLSGVTYRIASDETTGGDLWRDVAVAASHSGLATISRGVYGASTAYPSGVAGGVNSVYVPPTFYTGSPSGGSSTAAAPTFSPAAGTYTSAQTVTISSATSGATIHYTTDGSTPSATVGTVYSAPVTIAATTTLKAIATKSGMTDSGVTSGTYTISTGGVELLNFFTQAYTGTRSNYNGPVGYEFTPTQDITVTALGRCVSGTMTQSHAVRIWRVSNASLVASATVAPGSVADALGYKYETLGTPVTLLNGVTYRIASDETAGGDAWRDYGSASAHAGIATINRAVYGATVGAYPDGAWGGVNDVYVPPTFYTGGTTGGVSTVAAPSFSPAAGTYTNAQTVTISSATSGAEIRYTTDGSTPSTTVGTVYSAPVTIAATTTLKAIATQSGMTDSGVTSGTYTISIGGGGSLGEELLSNPGFETNTAGWTSFNGPAISRITSEVHSGAGACMSYKAAGTTGGCYQQNLMAVLNANGPGNYEISAWLKLKSGLGTRTGNVFMGLISSGGGETYPGVFDGTVTDSAFTKVSGTVYLTWSGTLTMANFYVSANPSYTELYIDDCSLRKVTDVLPSLLPSSEFSAEGVVGSTLEDRGFDTQPRADVIRYMHPTDSGDSELILNPGFDVDTTGWSGQDTVTSFGRVTGWQHTDPAACNFGNVANTPGTGRYTLDTATLAANGSGSFYELSAWVAPGGTGPNTISLLAGADGSTGDSYPGIFDVAVTKDVWQQVTATVQLTWSGTLQGAWFYVSTKNSYLAFDDCSMKQAKVATPTITPDGGEFEGGVLVTLACATSGTTIHYTTDGSDPDVSSTEYLGTPFTLTTSGTVKAKAFKTGYLDSDVATSGAFTITASEQVLTPVITPDGGEFVGSVNVTLTCATPDASIRYTTDGNDPTSESTAYSTPFSLTSTTTVKAKAWKEGLDASDVASTAFTNKVATPTITPNGGAFVGSVSVTLACDTPDATIRYTTDGSDPTPSSAAYGTPFSLNSGATVKAKAWKSDLAASEVASAVFVSKVAPPTISPNGGSFVGSVQVSLTCATLDATIRYTTDGSDPTTGSTVYSGPFTPSTSLSTVKAKAWKADLADSDIASAAFTIVGAELLSNTGFEVDLNGWTRNGSVLVWITSEVHSGSGSCYSGQTGGTTGGPYQQNLAASLLANGPGDYDVSAWMKLQGGTGNNVGQITVGLNDANGWRYLSVNGDISDSAFMKVSGTLDLTWSGTLNYVNFYLGTVSVPYSVMYIDDCSFKRSRPRGTVVVVR